MKRYRTSKEKMAFVLNERGARLLHQNLG